MKLIGSIIKCYNKLSIFGKVLIYIIMVLFVVSFFKKLFGSKMKKEGFIDENNFIFKEGDAVYDDFYATVYNNLVFNQIKNDFEIGAIINSTFANETSVIADIGCKTGEHTNELKNQISSNLSIIGIDKSPSLVQKAKENFPNLQFKVGNGLDDTLFNDGSLTHILCLDLAIYQMENKKQFFENCMKWNMSGGYLIVHLVDRHRFQQLLNSINPLYEIVPQGDSNTAKTKIAFKDFLYNANYKVDFSKDIALLEEKFKFPDGKIRKQEQKYFMEDITSIVSTAQNAGYIIHAKINLSDCDYQNEYLYVFSKPS